MKASSIMVCPVVDLKRALSDLERDVLRKVLFDGIQGIDAIHHARWKRHISRLLRSEPGEVTEFLNPRTRSLPFHQRWMAIERAIYDNQDNFPPTKAGFTAFRRWLKTGADMGEYHLVGDRAVYVPASVSFDECSDDEMREFVKAAEEFLQTRIAQRKLWPHMNAKSATEMVETLLKSAEKREQHA
jgi:hypothetical protein